MSRKRKATAPEYQLILSQKKNQSDSSLICTLRTIKEFRSFQYVISVDTEVRERQIRFNLKGLQTPDVALPHSGPAMFSTELPQVKGRYEIIVIKSDGEENSFVVNVRNKSIRVLSQPEKKFVDLITES